MAQSVVCMAGVSTGLKLEGLAAQGTSKTLQLNGNSAVLVRPGKTNVVSASLSHEEQETRSSRRSMITLLAATASVALAQKTNALSDIVFEGPPLPSGGLPGTENADQARDFDLDLSKRFFIQPLDPKEAVSRVKAAVDEIINVKALIDKKQWPYVQNDLRSKAQYLGFDLKTIIDSKDKPEKKKLLDLKKKLFDTINNLDYAARAKSTPNAEKYYAETVTLLTKFVELLA